MSGVSQIRRSIERLVAVLLENELLEIVAPAKVSAQSHAALGVIEGLFLASVFSSAFWSLLVFTVYSCR